jgi:predicted transcriptional regulator
MSTISLRLPDSLHEEIRKLAKRENISINQLATLAIAEKVAALDTADYLMRRASIADKKKFLRAMSKVADEEPDYRDVP